MLASCCSSTFLGNPSCASAPDAVPITEDCVSPPAARPDAVPGIESKAEREGQYDEEAGGAEHERHDDLGQRADAQ